MKVDKLKSIITWHSGHTEVLISVGGIIHRLIGVKDGGDFLLLVASAEPVRKEYKDLTKALR